MKLSRIRFAFPWRIAFILALLPCLPLLGFWAWLHWEVPPLQRYYLVVYWHSSEHANQPDARTQIRWLMETAPGRKRHWLFAFEVTEGSQNDLPLALSFAAVEQGWTGIERTPAESMDSTGLEKLLREDFYDGKTFRQLMNEPLVYGVTTWLTALVGGDDRVREAHRESVRVALRELERYTQARIGNVHAPETTGKFVAATFEHDTARPVDGYAAPQLHTHAVVFNVTERDNGQTRALQERSLFQSQQYATTVYRSELALKLQALGYEIERGKHGQPEIKGYRRDIV